MAENGYIQWFPGHMAKTNRKIKEDLKLVDIVAEIVDARIPEGSANPSLDKIIERKPRLKILNKSDLADPKQNTLWLNTYQQRGINAVLMDCKSGKGIKNFYNGIQTVLTEQISVWTERGMSGRPIRVMVVGIPNVGKSSMINRLISSSRTGKAEVQDRPGVTRQNRWFNVQKGFELLDTPGVLWPKFDDPEVGKMLAYTGAVKDEIVDMETLACDFLAMLMKLYPEAVNTRYKTQLDPQKQLNGHEILDAIGRKRGMLISGGEIDTERAAVNVLDEFRAGKLGRITLQQV